MVLGNYSLYSVVQGQSERRFWGNLDNIHAIAPEVGLDCACTVMVDWCACTESEDTKQTDSTITGIPSAAIFCMPPRSVKAVAPSCICSNIFSLSTGAVHVRLIAPAMPAQVNGILSALLAPLLLA